MAFDDTWHVWHATVSEFDIEFIANLVEPVASGKAFVNTVEELFAVIRFNFISLLKQVQYPVQHEQHKH